MIQSFKDKDSAAFFQGRRVRRFEGFAAQARRWFSLLNTATSLADLAGLPSNQLEQLHGDRQGQHSIRINEQWRICFIWQDDGPHDVEIVDYHCITALLKKERNMSIPAGPNKMPLVRPGEILQEELAYLGLTARQFSLALNVPPNRISAILHGHRGITVDTARRLARYFGTSPEMWLRLQMDYDLKRTQQADGARIAREVSPRAMAS
jgi:proteic killer suppression protein